MVKIVEDGYGAKNKTKKKHLQERENGLKRDPERMRRVPKGMITYCVPALWSYKIFGLVTTSLTGQTACEPHYLLRLITQTQKATAMVSLASNTLPSKMIILKKQQVLQIKSQNMLFVHAVEHFLI